MRSKANLVWRSVDVSRPGCVGLALRERLTEAPATYLNVCKAVVIALALLWASCAKDNEVGIVAATSDSGALDTSEASGAAPSDVTARSCRLEADGSCSPLTAETTCLPFTGRLYDEVGSCVTSAMTTLYCAAFASNGPGGFAEATGCYIENGDGGSVIYWTPSRDLGSVQATDHACDQSVSGRVVAAPQCGYSVGLGPTP
jgi:hypothetical protein